MVFSFFLIRDILKGKNATRAFANINQVYHTRKDDQKSQETTGRKKKVFTFPMFFKPNKLYLCELRTFLEIR
jgi:hypothetical protein